MSTIKVNQTSDPTDNWRSRLGYLSECDSATCIIYKDFESKQIRRSFTCQFHPELLSDLRTVGISELPTYKRFKTDDGARLFARLLYEGMQE